MSDFARAVEFAGCEFREPLTLDIDPYPYCDTHDSFDEPGRWPCPETERALALIREVRADECEQIRSDWAMLPGLDTRHDGKPTTAHALLLDRAEKHREAT